jgi:hypothetical protein
MRTKEEILQGEDETTFLTSCYFDFEKFYTRVLGMEVMPYHREWIQVLKNYKYIAISAPTGFGKTQLFGVGFPIWMAFFKPKSESLITSNTIRSQSAEILETIKITIETNELLRQLLPEDIKTSWTKEKMIMSNFSKIELCANSKSSRGHHPDYHFCDELAVYDDHETFWRDIITRVDNKKGIFAGVSTPVNTSDLLAQLMNKLKGNPKCFVKFYPCLVDKEGNTDINGDSIWPTRFPKSYILNEIKSKISLSDFEKNYLCNPKAESNDPFFPLSSVEDCYDITRSFTFENEGGIIYIGCDFAYSTGPTADWDAFIVVEYIGDKIILRHGERYHGIPIPAKLERLRELRRIYNPQMFVMDPNNVGTNIIVQLTMEGFPIESQSFQSLARRKLLVDLRVVIDNHRLIIPRNNDSMETRDFTDKLTEELIGFRDTTSKKTSTKQLVSTSAHDDTVMALAMACKGASMLNQSFEDPIGVGN